jgi:hypothetical protein
MALNVLSKYLSESSPFGNAHLPIEETAGRQFFSQSRSFGSGPKHYISSITFPIKPGHVWNGTNISKVIENGANQISLP